MALYRIPTMWGAIEQGVGRERIHSAAVSARGESRDHPRGMLTEARNPRGGYLLLSSDLEKNQRRVRRQRNLVQRDSWGKKKSGPMKSRSQYRRKAKYPDNYA